jgi:hypothetical protein
MNELFEIYLNKLNKGVYTVPLFKPVIEYACTRYGENRIDYTVTKQYSAKDYTLIYDTREAFDILIANFKERNPKLTEGSVEEWFDGVKKYMEYNDFILGHSGIGRIDLIIHYPRIDITNSNKASHVMYDTFIKVNLNYSCTMENQFRYKRSTFSSIEYSHNYAHSHVSRDYIKYIKEYNRIEWITSCLGDHSINGVIANINTSSILSIYDYMIFFDQLDSYLAWESIEGGPYINMNVLKNSVMSVQYNGGHSVTELATIKPQLLEIIERIMDNYVSIKICSDKHKILYRDLVVDIDNFETELVKEYLKAGYAPPNYLLCYRYKNGLKSEYYTGKLIHSEVNTKNIKILEFKGQPVYLRIKESAEEDKVVDDIVFLPEILNNFLSALKINLNKINTKLK